MPTEISTRFPHCHRKLLRDKVAHLPDVLLLGSALFVAAAWDEG